MNQGDCLREQTTTIMEEAVEKEELADVLVFEVEFTGMTEEDFEFLRNLAKQMKEERDKKESRLAAC